MGLRSRRGRDFLCSQNDGIRVPSNELRADLKISNALTEFVILDAGFEQQN